MEGKAAGILKNVISLADVLEDSSKHSVELMLLDASQRAANELPHIKKAVVIFYDPDNGLAKEIRWNQAGLTHREMLKLLSLAHDEIMLDVTLMHDHN